MSEQPHQLSEIEVALISAHKAIIDVLLNAGIVSAKVLEEIFAEQRNAAVQKGMPVAAGVMEILRLFASDPEREAFRQQLRRAAKEPPQGSA